MEPIRAPIRAPDRVEVSRSFLLEIAGYLQLLVHLGLGDRERAEELIAKIGDALADAES